MKTRFVDKMLSKTGKLVDTFSGYINYIDRNAAVRSEKFTKYNLSSQYQNYNDYMSNPEKSGGIFTAAQDALTKKQMYALKQAFQKGYDNDSIMWQTVVSFDNRFLAQLGIYDPATGVLDEGALQAATRRMMRETLKQENMEHSAIWSAAIHYNTDNIHIHIAYTEPFSTRQRKMVDGQDRPRGYFSAKTFRAMKSKVVNTLLENEYTAVDKLMREKLIGGKKKNFALEDKKFKDLWFRIYDNLPEEKKQWFYNMNAIAPLRPLLDELSTKYIRSHHAEEFAEFQKLIMKQQEIYQTAYGQNGHYQNYAKNKMNDLYSRMGNSLLTEMRQYSFSHYEQLGRIQGAHSTMGTRRILGNLKNSLRNSFEHEYHENERQYRRLQAAIDQGGIAYE